MPDTPRGTSPVRRSGSLEGGSSNVSQRGSPTREQADVPLAPWVPGEPITYSPPGMAFPGGHTSIEPNSNGSLGVDFPRVSRVPIGVLHGSGAGLAGNPGWAGNPFTMQAPDGAGLRVPQPENAQGGSGGPREVLRLLSQYLLKELDKEGWASAGDGPGQDKRRVMLDEK